MKYDDASWHYEGNFPPDLPEEAGGTHIAMFVAWGLLSDLGGSLHAEDFVKDLEQLRKRELTPGEYFFRVCDGKFTDEDFNEDGNTFTKVYFDFDNPKGYLTDYDKALCAKLPSLYHVEDSWENYDKLRIILDKRLAHWRGKQEGGGWSFFNFLRPRS